MNAAEDVSNLSEYTKHFSTQTIEEKYEAIKEGTFKVDGKNYDLNDLDPFILQGDKISCALRAQEVILRDYGIIIPKEELVEFAEQKGWFSLDPETGGTEKEDIGNILDACGISTTRKDNATIDDILSELNAGHRVIVGVDCNELWIKNEPNLFKRLYGNVVNKVNDLIDNIKGVEDGGNHALIVSAVNVDTESPDKATVNLIDTGTGQVCAVYTIKEFRDAWSDANGFMVSTNIPAPFQYNHETHLMEPSGVETSFIPSMIELPNGLNNRFILGDDYYEQYGSFQPTYNKSFGICDSQYTQKIDIDADFDWQLGYQSPYDGMTIQPTQQFILNNCDPLEGIQLQQYVNDSFSDGHTLGSINSIDDTNEIDVMESSFGLGSESDVNKAIL